ncbi:MAG: acyl-CoA thioester hydrolase [Alphaproteobacteria bacterium]|nr:MAG: acyl-CoA thioester hydrolase [Caulobacteraceae bacterium]TPW08288.1 MAG: acyl-CoA thioester hydrolase [Alphaproteobacteria bacterium]
MNRDEPTAGRFDGRSHILPVRIYYEDTDFSGVVYHANYLRYFERGRSDYLRLAGVSHTELLEGEAPTAFAVNRITLDFVKPARIDDALTVESTYDRVKGPRIFISQAIRRGQDVIATAAVEACCISLTGRPRKPPVLLLQRLQPFLEP